MPGSILRTNYHRTGGKLDITAIGGGYLANAAVGGSGSKDYNGGFIYIMSYSGSIGGSTKSFSNWIADSAYGLLSWVYTSLSPGSGYKFLPLGVRLRSVSDANLLSVGQSVTMVGGGIGAGMNFSFSHTGGSLVIIHMPKYNYGGATGSAASFPCGSGITAKSYSGEAFLADIWGFIVSAP